MRKLSDGSTPHLRAIDHNERPVKSGPYVASRFTLSSGERIAVILDSYTGVPPDLALRYAFAERGKGGAQRLTGKLRRIAELYNWLSLRWNRDPDVALQGLPEITGEMLCMALRSAIVVRSEHSKRIISRRARKPTNEVGGLTNRRIEAWSSFLSFVYRPAQWMTGLDVASGYHLREKSQAQIETIKQTLEAQRIAPLGSDSHLALQPNELAIIDRVLRHNLCNFSEQSLIRNRSMVYTARTTAIRKGELLKIKLSHLPCKESQVAALIRKNSGSPLILKVERNHDDAGDSRSNEPRVKRGGRLIEISDDLFELLNKYIELRANFEPETQYLFLTSDGKRPISISRTDAIMKTISRSAILEFERQFPGVEHTLAKLTWHRLRTTRANELVRIYFPDNQWDPNSEDDFLYALGWKSRESARPYLMKLRRHGASELLRSDREALRAMIQPRQA